MTAMLIIKPGMLTTVQDRGRWGLQARGVPVGGPMDPLSHRLANVLVGNDGDAATLEITLLGPEIEFDDERVVAITGADFELTLDGRPARSGQAFVVPAETRMRFGARRRGARAYLAVSGGIATAPVLGSRATHVISALGGFEGRPLRAGDRVPLGPVSATGRTVARPAEPFVELPAGTATLRIITGPQADHFAAGAIAALQSAPYVIEQQSDRMGFRLAGPSLEHSGGADIISDATPLGVLQVPASGQPILLMADRQTTGGYPKIATVITADLPIAGQLGPGDTITFRACTLQDAMAALIAQERALLRFETSAA
jgi:antagonist of KipI